MKKYIILLTCLYGPFAGAAIFPTPLPDDYRITEVQYNPNQVVKIRTAIGVNTLIKLQKGENIDTDSSGMGLGDLRAWGIEPKQNSFFIKPAAYNPNTNMNIVTNKGRTYSFILELSEFPHFQVRFVYEKAKSKAHRKEPAMPCNDGSLNFSYSKWGDAEIAPQFMWDDGKFTCLKFMDNHELPVAYQVASDGTESLLNYSIQKDTMILHGISKEFRLRLGKQVLGLKSDNVVSSGYNEKATSTTSRRKILYEQ